MPQINLASVFAEIDTNKTSAKGAKEAAAKTGWDGACAVAMYFAGALLPDNAAKTIADAYKAGTGKDMPKPMVANYMTFARAGAAGVFDQWKSAWDHWVAFCGAQEPKPQPTGDAFNTIRDVLNHNAKPDRKGNTFEASAKGIGLFRQYKADSRNSPEKLVERLNDLANDVRDSVPEIGDDVQRGVLALIKLVKDARPDDFAVTKQPVKRKILRLPESATPAPVTDVSSPVTPAPSNVVDMQALLGMLQQQSQQIAALMVTKKPKK